MTKSAQLTMSLALLAGGGKLVCHVNMLQVYHSRDVQPSLLRHTNPVVATSASVPEPAACTSTETRVGSPVQQGVRVKNVKINVGKILPTLSFHFLLSISPTSLLIHKRMWSG